MWFSRPLMFYSSCGCASSREGGLRQIAAHGNLLDGVEVVVLQVTIHLVQRGIVVDPSPENPFRQKRADFLLSSRARTHECMHFEGPVCVSLMSERRVPCLL